MGKPNWILIASILFVSLIIFLGMKFFRAPANKSTSNKQEGFEESTGGTKVATVKFFFANWCKYCQRAKPQYEAVKNSMNGQVINGTKIQFEEIDCTDPTPQVEALLDQYYVKEYPTIKLVIGNDVFTFDEQVTSQNLQSFIQGHV